LHRAGRNRNSGFTLVEALLSVVVLAVMATVVSAMYISGLQALDVQADRAMLDSQLRSRMEFLLSEEFGQLADGSATVTVSGQDYTISWTIANVDLDGDATPEPSAKQITVTLGGRSLTTLVVDPEGKVGKI
jgi:prepilin-type N-terminal cleavage/methylation domain-containing protein